MPIALTMGDGAGIGPEIVLGLLRDPDLASRALVYGSRHVLSLTRAHLQRHAPDMLWPEPAHVVDVTGSLPTEAAQAIEALDAIPFGQTFAPFAHLQRTALTRAIDDAMAKRVAGICTAPLNKALFKAAGLPPTGHTEILAARTGAARHVMLLAGDRLRVALATTHLPLKEVSSKLSIEHLIDVIECTCEDLSRRWGFESPRIAVAALNPHAGEEGTMGDEEVRIIGPAIAAARARGLDVTGPWPSDTLFAKAGRESWPYDAVICMYHDQALIPLKLLHFGRSANITLGLPIVRTSVDHGTAYDIAGQGIADVGSLRYAFELAESLA